MQVSEHIHALRISFKTQDGKERFVYVYLIYQKHIFLVDSGVYGSKDKIFDYIRGTGRDPGEIAMIIFTHSHPDHIGGALGIQQAVKCKTAAHVGDVPWIEDTELQARERPVPGLHRIVEGPVKINFVVQDGDNLALDGNSTLHVIHTPGHSKGQVALFYAEDGALFTGDCVPVPGQMPIYEDVISSVASIRKLEKLEQQQLTLMLSSWDEPRRGQKIHQAMTDGINYIQRVHSEVLKAKEALKTSDVVPVAEQVSQKLGFTGMTAVPLFLRSIEAHLKASDYSVLPGA